MLFTMRAYTSEHRVRTSGRGFVDVTAALGNAVRASEVRLGQCTAFIQHTSASLVITENADPQVRRDLETFFARLVRDGDPIFEHDAEGPDDMPAHVRAALTQTSIVIPIVAGNPTLGAWQGLYLYEHRRAPHERRITFLIVGE
jgi:secondary thiamine-phosphate synthase enzyme